MLFRSTLFCYKIKKHFFRKIDKDYIITYYENICSKSPSQTNLERFLSFFSDVPKHLKDYHMHKNHYNNKQKELLILNDEENEIIVKQILNINKDYYSKCRNISFNDLLLYKNVNNFVCFTGTAYIIPPIDFRNINYNEIINYSSYKQFKKVS